MCYLTDYHTHTRLSPDSTAALSDMAQAAIAAGLNELCITDHVDLLNEHGVPLTQHSWADALTQFNQSVPMLQDRLKLKLGLELGLPHINRKLTEKILSLPQLDFVIGSIHNLSPQRGGGDFFFLDCQSLDSCYEVLDDYFASMALLAETDCFDVLGHIIYPLRYMRSDAALDGYWERIDAIFRTAAECGRGIEVNTYRGRTIADWRPVLQHYKACGGEIITVGSDAHIPCHVAAGIRDACQLIADAGFRYIAVYTGRKPEFHKL